ncbi:MAG: hypothetical protein WCJ58_02690 [bacterium]
MKKISLYQDLKDSRPSYKLLLSMPFIYGMIIPIVFLDLGLELYHQIAFRLYGMKRLNRKAYIFLDRHHLSKLSSIEKVNCTYCGYANGVFAYARDISAETEKYWCAIKHADEQALEVMPHEEDFFDQEAFV